MFIVTLFGTIIAVLFGLCGLLSGAAFFLDAQQGMTLYQFLSGFINSTWPLMAGCILGALIKLLEELHGFRVAYEAAGVARMTAVESAPERTSRHGRHAEKAAPAAASIPTPSPTPYSAHVASHAGEKPSVVPTVPVFFPIRDTKQETRVVAPAEQAAAAEQRQADGLTFFKTH